MGLGCSRTKVLTIENGKTKKHIYLVEALESGNPCRMGDLYDRVARITLASFLKKNPTYQPVIHILNSQSDDVDPVKPARIIAEAAATEALAVVGFAWSTSAGIAAGQAAKENIPYIAPTAVIRSVLDGAFSISLGTPVREAARGFEYLMAQLGYSEVIIAEATDQIQEREYADAIRQSFPAATTIQYQDSFPTKEIVSSIAALNGKKFLLFVPGYTNVKRGLEAVLETFPKAAIVVGPQWSHDHKMVDFDADLYCISDYFNLIENAQHMAFTKAWVKDGGEITGGYPYSLFDALLFTLDAMDSEDVQSRSDLIARIKNYGAFDGTKGLITVKKSTLSKPIYVLKYEKGRGFNLIGKV